MSDKEPSLSRGNAGGVVQAETKAKKTVFEQDAQQVNVFKMLPPSVWKEYKVESPSDIPKEPEKLKPVVQYALDINEVPKEYHKFIHLKLTDNVNANEDKVIVGYAHSRGEAAELPRDEQNLHRAFLDTRFAGLMGAIQRGDTATAKTESSLFSMEDQVVAMNSTLLAADYTDKEILRFDSQLHDAMVAGHDEAMQEGKKKGLSGERLEDYANSEANKAGVVFVAESPLYLQLIKKDPAAAQEFRTQAEIAFGKGSIADEAYDSKDQRAWTALQDASTKQEVRQVATEYSLANPMELGNLFGFISGAFEGAEVKSPGAEAAASAQAQAMDTILRQKDADQMNKEMREMLEELKAKNEKDTIEEADLSPETKEMLEKMGIEKEDTIKEAIEAVETIIANVEMQQEKIGGLTQGFDEGDWKGGMMPPLHEDPKDVLEKNGIVDEDGKLTELGKEVMPELLKESAADFMQACDTILFRIEIAGNEELMDKLNDAKKDVENYMANPESVEKLAAFNEAMQDPEIVAVHAAFFEAIAENAGEVVAGRHEEE